eukprot:86284_1
MIVPVSLFPFLTYVAHKVTTKAKVDYDAASFVCWNGDQSDVCWNGDQSECVAQSIAYDDMQCGRNMVFQRSCIDQSISCFVQTCDDRFEWVGRATTDVLSIVYCLEVDSG